MDFTTTFRKVHSNLLPYVYMYFIPKLMIVYALLFFGVFHGNSVDFFLKYAIFFEPYFLRQINLLSNKCHSLVTIAFELSNPILF